MKKRVFLGKFIIYLVLFLGIVLSVIAYFYTDQQIKTSWKNNQQIQLDLKASNLEKNFYMSLLDLRTFFALATGDDFEVNLDKHKNFDAWTQIKVEHLTKKNNIHSISFNQKNNNKLELEITKGQINSILAGAVEYGYYFFTLDGENLYVAFIGSEKGIVSKINVARVKPLFKEITEYSAYVINVLNENSNIIYNQSYYTQEENVVLTNFYKNANAEFQLTVLIDPKGVDGTSGYSILIMGIILLLTFAIVTYLLRQNASLNHLNKKMLKQSDSLKSAYTLFKKITGSSFDIISVVDANLKIEYANSSYAKVLNYNPAKIQGLMFYDLLPELEKDKLIRNIKSFDYNKGTLSFEFEMLHVNKKDRILVEAMVHAIYDQNREVANYIIHCKDVTSKRESLKALLQSKRRFKDFADSSADWLWETDSKLKFSFISSGIKQSTGFSIDDLVGKKINSLFYKSSMLVNKLTNDKGSIKDIEIKVQSKTKEEIWLRISAIPVYTEKDGFVGYRGVGRNITFLKVEQERVIELATKDYLTGLLNRSAFMYELNNILNLSRRNGTQGALLFIDIDMFKMINESHGHEAGDKVLKEISALLNVSLRNTDTIGRIGGDEFAVVMHDINPQEARKKITELINKLSSKKLSSVI